MGLGGARAGLLGGSSEAVVERGGGTGGSGRAGNGNGREGRGGGGGLCVTVV